MENKKITLTHKDAEIFENMISYYHVHTVEKIQEKHPGFVVDDFEKVLAILEKVLEVWKNGY